LVPDHIRLHFPLPQQICAYLMPFRRYNVTKKKVWTQSTKICCHGNVLFEGSKNNFRWFIYGQSSTIPANFVKIGPVDVETGLTKVAKTFFKNASKHTGLADLRGANYCKLTCKTQSLCVRVVYSAAGCPRACGRCRSVERCSGLGCALLQA